MNKQHSFITFWFCFVLFLVTLHGETKAQEWQPTNESFLDLIWGLEVNHNNGDIYAGTRGSGGFRSSDNGGNWSALANGMTGHEPACFAFKSSGEIFAGTNDHGAFRSDDNGDTWVQINNGLTNLLVLGLAINSDGDIFAGTRGGGVHRSSDNGNTWTPVNTGLTNLDIRRLEINADGDIFIGTWGGVFRSSDNGDSRRRYLCGHKW